MERRPKILVIEDDQFLNRLYADQLSREGFEVSQASAGDEGFSKIVSEKPDLVLLDLILPRRDGFDILSAMRLKPATKDIPVIILTNLGQESDIKTGLELGAVAYFVKTDFSITKLGEVVRQHLAARQRPRTEQHSP